MPNTLARFALAGGFALMLAGCAARSPGQTPAHMRAEIAAMAAEYPHDLAAAKAAGLPLSMAELEKPLPPASQNAALVYDRMTAVLEAHDIKSPDDVINDIATRQLPSEAQLTTARKALSDRSDLIRLVHGAVSKPKCVFDKDWTMPDPSEITFPEYPTMRQAARLLEAQSEVQASEGKPLDAVKNQALGFRIADDIGTTGKFDGGSPAVKPAASETVFHYPLPPYLAPAK